MPTRLTMSKDRKKEIQSLCLQMHDSTCGCNGVYVCLSVCVHVCMFEWVCVWMCDCIRNFDYLGVIWFVTVSVTLCVYVCCGVWLQLKVDLCVWWWLNLCRHSPSLYQFLHQNNYKLSQYVIYWCGQHHGQKQSSSDKGYLIFKPLIAWPQHFLINLLNSENSKVLLSQGRSYVNLSRLAWPCPRTPFWRSLVYSNDWERQSYL